MMKDLKLYFQVFALFLVFIGGAYLGGKITFGVMETLREENKGLIRYVTALEKEIKVRDISDKIIQCESGGQHYIYGDGGRSFGIAQFQKNTIH